MNHKNLGFLPPTFVDEQFAKERDYWVQKLSGAPVITGIPLDFTRKKVFSDEKADVGIQIEPDLASQLLKFCGNKDTLVFSVLVTVTTICLYKYTGISDILIGTAIHAQYREIASLNKVLILRNLIRGTVSIKQLFHEVKRTLSEAYSNQKYPFDRILDLLDIEYPNNRAPLFNVAVLLDSINDREHIRSLKNDITLNFSIIHEGIVCTIEYNESLFKRKTIETFVEHYQKILQAILKFPDIEISQIQLLSTDKKQELLFNFNSTQRDYPRHQTIHGLFEEQVQHTPDKVAVVFENQHLTYSNLNYQSNQLAHCLMTKGVGPGVMVGIYLEHSEKMIVSLLGVLKAGGAYVPFDPESPLTRLSFMLSDAQIPLVITEEKLSDNLPQTAKTVCLDFEWASLAVENSENPRNTAAAPNYVYAIYTSGSTGQPKGVLITHNALVNYIWWAKQVYLKNEQLNFALYSSLAFDLTVTSIFTPLITGNQVIVYRRMGKEVLLERILRENKVDILKLTPSHLKMLKDLDNSDCRVKRLIVGGEALETILAREVYQSFGKGKDVEIFNEYGPTEATVGCMIYQFSPDRDDQAFVPIGYPADNTQVYVLNKTLTPVAENEIGELYIAGDGLAQGYLNQPQLTAERFIPHLFLCGKKMYQTSDLARWLPEGIIEFLGRTDDQVKFYGHRVELNEIKSALNQHPKVRDSVIIVERDDNGNDVMIAYYVSRQELEIRQLRIFLREYIIESIVPNIFVHVRKLPLTLNGKVNLQALPPLDKVKQHQLKATFTAPRTSTEKRVATIWTEVLGIAKIGIDENFFELGGHSLLATQVISRIRAAFQVDISLQSLFEAPTVRDLTTRIEGIRWTMEENQISVNTLADNREEGEL